MTCRSDFHSIRQIDKYNFESLAFQELVLFRRRITEVQRQVNTKAAKSITKKELQEIVQLLHGTNSNNKKQRSRKEIEDAIVQALAELLRLKNEGELAQSKVLRAHIVLAIYRHFRQNLSELMQFECSSNEEAESMQTLEWCVLQLRSAVLLENELANSFTKHLVVNKAVLEYSKMKTPLDEGHTVSQEISLAMNLIMSLSANQQQLSNEPFEAIRQIDTSRYCSYMAAFRGMINRARACIRPGLFDQLLVVVKACAKLARSVHPRYLDDNALADVLYQCSSLLIECSAHNTRFFEEAESLALNIPCRNGRCVYLFACVYSDRVFVECIRNRERGTIPCDEHIQSLKNLISTAKLGEHRIQVLKQSAKWFFSRMQMLEHVLAPHKDLGLRLLRSALKHFSPTDFCIVWPRMFAQLLGFGTFAGSNAMCQHTHLDKICKISIQEILILFSNMIESMT